MGFKIAEAFVHIGARMGTFNKAIDQAHGKMRAGVDAMSASVAGLGARLAAALSVGAIGAGIAKSVSLASDLNEQLSKVATVFGESAAIITGTADEMAAKFGLVKTTILEAASNIGLIGKGAGLTANAAAAMGAQLAKLAADASSFYNVELDVALEKIRAGLTGESEPLKAFGVLLSEAKVKAEIANTELKKMAETNEEGAKVLARYNIILRSMTDASGDLERTSAGLANQTRELTGRVENLATAFGQELVPAATTAATKINEALSSIGDAFTRNREFIRAWGQELIGQFDIIFKALQNLDFIMAGLNGKEAVFGAVFDRMFVNLRDTVKEAMPELMKDPPKPPPPVATAAVAPQAERFVETFVNPFWEAVRRAALRGGGEVTIPEKDKRDSELVSLFEFSRRLGGAALTREQRTQEDQLRATRELVDLVRRGQFMMAPILPAVGP